jgi:hypothetical protein
MPNFSDIKSIPLDKFQMQKNPTPKKDPTNNQFFVYIDFPAQGYPVKFNPMLFDSTGKPQNILNFTVSSSIDDKPYPMVYFALNGKFQMADLQSYIPVGIQITQKIHDSNVIGKSTSKDLQMIFECNQVGGSGVLFVHFLLTVSTETTGDDFNKIFENMTYIEQINTNTKNFETQNQKPAPFKYNFMSGISNQFGVDTTNPVKNSMKSFYFLDTNKNKHILLQTPIPINATNFTKIQDFYESYTIATNPYKIYSTSNLTPDKDAPITNDVLVGSMESLKDAQTNPPQSIDETNNQAVKDKKDAQSQKNVEAAEKANEGFIGSFFTGDNTGKEGLKTMNCRVAQSSNKLVATLVGNEKSQTSALDGYALVIIIGIFLGLIAFVVSLVKNIFYGIKPKEKNKITLQELYNAITRKSKLISFAIAILYAIGIILIILMIAIPKISTNASFFCIILGIIMICIAITIQASIQLYNSKSIRNRYPFAYSIIKNQLSTFINDKSLSNIEKILASNNNDTPTGTGDVIIKQQFFIFLNQCMSFYFGDNKWYTDKSNKDSVHKIISIGYQKDNDGNKKKDTIDIKFNTGEPITYEGFDKLELPVDTTK